MEVPPRAVPAQASAGWEARARAPRPEPAAGGALMHPSLCLCGREPGAAPQMLAGGLGWAKLAKLCAGAPTPAEPAAPTSMKSPRPHEVARPGTWAALTGGDRAPRRTAPMTELARLPTSPPFPWIYNRCRMQRLHGTWLQRAPCTLPTSNFKLVLPPRLCPAVFPNATLQCSRQCAALVFCSSSPSCLSARQEAQHVSSSLCYANLLPLLAGITPRLCGCGPGAWWHLVTAACKPSSNRAPQPINTLWRISGRTSQDGPCRYPSMSMLPDCHGQLLPRGSSSLLRLLPARLHSIVLPSHRPAPPPLLPPPKCARSWWSRPPGCCWPPPPPAPGSCPPAQPPPVPQVAPAPWTA